MIPTPDTEQIIPGGFVKQSSGLAGHHDEGGGEPVVLEDLSVRADKSEIETNWGGGGQVLATKPDIADVRLAQPLDGLYQLRAEQVEVGLVNLVVDLQHPAVLVALEPHHEGLVEVDAGALALLALNLLGDVLCHRPAGDHVALDVDGDVEGLVQPLSSVDNFQQLPAFLRRKSV